MVVKPRFRRNRFFVPPPKRGPRGFERTGCRAPANGAMFPALGPGATNMKLSWKIAIGLAGLGALCAYFLFSPDDHERRELEQTRRELRQQGFKTELSEFDFTTSPELRTRERALTNASLALRATTPENYARQAALREGQPNLMTVVASNAVLVVWQQPKLPAYVGGDLWPGLREALRESRPELDAACDAALSGPIGFDLNASHGTHMLLRHCAVLKNLVQTLGQRAMLELHDGNPAAARTNLLALTRLVTAWNPEPAEVSHLVRFACATIAFNATWQALQAEGWTDNELAALQAEWESADFFQGLPETAAFSRAGTAALCKLEREAKFESGMTFSDMARRPKYAWQALAERVRRMNYRQHGSYEYERAVLLYFRDWELDLRRAIQATSWVAMSQLPGVTNAAPFQPKHRSAFQAQMNVRQIATAAAFGSPGFHGQGYGLLGRAADAEARRRLLVAALALERHRRQHGGFPKALAEIAPGLLAKPPVDFMDGQPLRYQPTDDGHFVLYSVGLDGNDDGGQTAQPETQRPFYPGNRPNRLRQDADLVWPRPASAVEIAAYHQEQWRALADQIDQRENAQAHAQWERTARRQALATKILSAKPAAVAANPTHRGQPLSEIFRLASDSSTNRLTWLEMFTLKQVVTGEEPETVTFQLPLSYDAVTNLGELCLLVDPVRDENSDEGCEAGLYECQRAADGGCLLVWSTIYETPGQHALQLGLSMEAPEQRGLEFITGPVAPFTVSNLCQFSVSSAHFNPAVGATLHAKLPEPVATYRVELTSPEGVVLRNFTGSTSNGVLKQFWDLNDDHGRRCTNHSYGSRFHITLPESGRSQSLRGP